MTKIKSTPTDNQPQIDKFKEAARELECDDNEQRFKERLGKLVKPKAGTKGQSE
ncbi:hypothetical protein [Erythrobacter sp. QSSC1-22B]|uniref:hypothetical protein n=1 Tax=Erythrobacter sp. QSSC1-22B TaxID=1860125 RepID=UPI00143BE34F|nr:hypothetical protein [Erythrobacter sp. QSSC1-22B]